MVEVFKTLGPDPFLRHDMLHVIKLHFEHGRRLGAILGNFQMSLTRCMVASIDQGAIIRRLVNVDIVVYDAHIAKAAHVRPIS
jgi:hypothetical protein